MFYWAPGDNVEASLTSYKTCGTLARRTVLRGAFYRATLVLYSMYASARVVNWHYCKTAIRPTCTKRIWIPSGYHHRWLDLAWVCTITACIYRSVWTNTERVLTPYSPGPGWSWPSPQRAGSSSSRWAGAGRGAAWRAPSATPSQGRSEETGRDNITQSTSHHSTVISASLFRNKNKIWSHALNFMKSKHVTPLRFTAYGNRFYS